MNQRHGTAVDGSSSVKAIHYDRASQEMTVDFHRSGRYVYYQIPEQVHAELMASPSKGTYLHQNIKHRYHCVST